MITNEKLRWLSGQTRSRVARSSDAGLYRPRCGRADRPGAHAGCHFCDCLYEYAVRAFELNAVDYLLKPYDNERLHGSIKRARERIAEKRQANLSAQLQALLDSRAKKWPERIVVKDGERFDFVSVDSIDWIESANNYVEMHCGSRRHLLGESLSNLETRLNPARFLRVHRCHIVNLSRILAIHPLLSGTYELELRGGARLTTGRQYKTAIQALIRN